MEWYWILIIALGSFVVWIVLSILFYKQFFKRFYDFVLSLFAILILSPVYLILTITGAIALKGNPFFLQTRPGKNEKLFGLIKFRSMSNQKDSNGNLLPDEKRLGKYGKFLRKTSLDELPELFNILKGDMSIVGPRPLLVEYLPYYTSTERHRHDIRPGLTGLSQIHGRNFLVWEERFKLDLEYKEKISLFLDIKIILDTVFQVFRRKNVADRSEIFEDKDGEKYILINGEKKKYPKPLNVERKDKLL